MKSFLISRIWNAPQLTVIVPIFNAFDYVVDCLESILARSRCGYSLHVVNDASTDGRVINYLKNLEQCHAHVQVTNSNVNQGYTASVNLACREAHGDVVLLNSDTQVPFDWLGKLRDAAYSRKCIGTVTAVSDNAGAFSIPVINCANQFPADWDFFTTADFVRRNARRALTPVPTGNGFCLYIKRSVFKRIGYFDEVNFPRGYGEENDFCQRAIKAGFENVIDDSIYVLHAKGESFGVERESLIEEGVEIVHRLHPEYAKELDDFFKNHPLAYWEKVFENIAKG